MRNSIKIFIIIILGIILPPDWAEAAEPAVIRLHFFQGIRAEGQAGLSEVQIFPIASRPEFAAIKEGLGESEAVLTANMLEALLDIYDLQAVDDLFRHEAGWDGKSPLRDDWIIGKTNSFRVQLVPKRISAQQIALHVGIDRTKSAERTMGQSRSETIFKQDLILDLNEPVIIGLPNPAGDYFLLAWASAGTLDARKRLAPKSKTIYYVNPPKTLAQVQPVFPEELRRRNLAGRIGLRITIDEKGYVQHVDVEKPLHAYLNYTAVQAFLRWTFEPIRIEGKPAAASFRFGYDFNPWLYMQEVPWAVIPSPKAGAYAQGDLGRVLDQTAEYCQKLAAVASDYVCEESIQETHYDLLNNRSWGVLSVTTSSRTKPVENPEFADPINSGLIADEHKVAGRLLFEQWFQNADPQRNKRIKYLCDYQIFRKDKTVEEHRKILKENGKKPADPEKKLRDRRYSAFGSLFAPIKVLAKNRQSRFDFEIEGEEKANGKKALILAASPKSGDEDGIWGARIWVDKENFRVLKCEIEGVPIDGHEDILNECAALNIRPRFLMTYEYKTEKNEVLFPWRSEVLVAYSGIDAGGPVPRMKIFMNYDKYKFFTVATESQVIR